MTAHRYTVIALFDPVAVGTAISRNAWPGHVTLAGIFTTDASVDEIVEAMRSTALAEAPITVRLAGTADFGPDGDIPVRLVEAGRASVVHLRLADALEPLPGFVADDPGYWRAGYRPHVTLTPTVDVAEGDTASVATVVLVELDSENGTVVAVHPVPA